MHRIVGQAGGACRTHGGTVVVMATFPQAVNQQIANEFGASQQYAAIAVYFDAQTLEGLAAHFYRQAVEERNHAMMLVQYLLDMDEQVEIPGVDAPQTAFADALALAQEKRVTEQIVELSRIARAEGDLVGEQFLHWFLKEQREEVASMSTLLAIMERAGDNLLLVEDYLSRQKVGDGGVDADAPEAAGGAL
jgi:ferritin